MCYTARCPCVSPALCFEHYLKTWGGLGTQSLKDVAALYEAKPEARNLLLAKVALSLLASPCELRCLSSRPRGNRRDLRNVVHHMCSTMVLQTYR